MYFLVYKITNIINNKIYIGVHKTKNIDDGYMGSGTLIRRSIKKHGMDNFVKEILFVYDNEYDMFNKEKELVTESFVQRTDTYNICIGGCGGFDHINDDIELRQSKNRKARKTTDSIILSKYNVTNPCYIPGVLDKISKKMKERHEQGIYDHVAPPSFKGKKHSDETKKIIGEKNSINTGEKNSQFGTMWITNGSDNKKISKLDEIPEGWRKGRCIKRSQEPR